ncbi:MAG: ArsR/SmtB family transcription factor [Anaerolineales bacterium]
MSNNHMAEPNLSWDWGTAYDLFISLEVLHNPSTFGLRAAWAAGMRSRLPSVERETLEQLQKSKMGMPLHWVHGLPDPKDGASVLRALKEMPPEERLEAMTLKPSEPAAFQAVFKEVRDKGAWDDTQLEELITQAKEMSKREKIDPDTVEIALDWWAEAELSGERLLTALRAYYEGFFAEEENRIRPALQAGLERAQELAERMPVLDLLEELSQGVILDEGFKATNLVLAPSFWGSPLLIFDKVAKDREIILFGARPLDASLVPGEVVPDALLRGLKALSDSTRLRILRYLSDEALTPSQLSRRLRLRSSTVVHHLDVLRLATLVQFRIGEHGKDRRYAVRPEALESLLSSLEIFLGQTEPIEVKPLPAEAEIAGD